MVVFTDRCVGDPIYDDLMRREDVMRWVSGYEAAWRAGDLAAVGDLFTEDATYLRSPYGPTVVGVEAIRGFWLDDEGEMFTMTAEPVAVEDRTAVVRVLVRYGDPVHEEYTDLWVIRFAPDGRAEWFEEWPYFPDQPFTTDA